MTDVTRSRLARMLRDEIPERERQDLEARFLEDDVLFNELAREEEELLEAWEEGDLDGPTTRAMEDLLETSTRIQTLRDMTRSLDEAEPATGGGDPEPAPHGVQAVLAHRSLPWILWSLAGALALALALVLFLQYRMVRLLDERIDGMGPAIGEPAEPGEPARASAEPSAGPPLRLDAALAGMTSSAAFERSLGLSVEIRLDRTLLPGSYVLELEESASGRIAHRTDLSLERSLFPGDPLRVVIPGAALGAGDYRLGLREAPEGVIAVWPLQLVEE